METGRVQKCIELTKKVKLRNKKVLDLGCSGGWMIEEALSQKAKSYTGIDVNKKSITAAKKKYSKGIYKVGSAVDIPFKNNSFGVIMAFDVLEHIPIDTEGVMFSEIFRVLKPKGYLLLSTPQRSFWGTLLDPAWYFGHRHYTHQDLKEYCKKSGLKLKILNTGGWFWESIGLINLYIMKFVFKRGLLFQEFFENKRSKEYKKDGFVTLFLVAQK